MKINRFFLDPFLSTEAKAAGYRKCWYCIGGNDDTYNTKLMEKFGMRIYRIMERLQKPRIHIQELDINYSHTTRPSNGCKSTAESN